MKDLNQKKSLIFEREALVKYSENSLNLHIIQKNVL